MEDFNAYNYIRSQETLEETPAPSRKIAFKKIMLFHQKSIHLSIDNSFLMQATFKSRTNIKNMLKFFKI